MVLSIQRPQNINAAENRRSTNLLLNLLSESELQRLLRDSEPIIIPAKTTLYQPNKTIKRVYFPLQGVISLMNICEAALIAESVAVSNEGMVGINAILGYEFTSNFVTAQTKCSAFAIPLNHVRQEFHRDREFQRIILRYIQARFTQAYQNIFCSCHHTLEQRLARWLLYYSDRLKTRKILLTQETLSDLIGVRRSSLSVVAANLRQKKLIDYSRGRINILNPKVLEQVGCNCNSVIAAEYSRLLIDK